MPEQLVMLSEKCRACRRCEVACISAHNDIPFKDAMKRRNEFTCRMSVIKTDDFKTTVRCHACEDAPCVKVCPTSALTQNERGEIDLAPELCIACEMCVNTCPYGACRIDAFPVKPALCETENPALAEIHGGTRYVAVRCDLCRSWRKENGKKFTACMEACVACAIGMRQEDGTVIFPEPPQKKPAAPTKA